jgi:hypothetical protein
LHKFLLGSSLFVGSMFLPIFVFWTSNITFMYDHHSFFVFLLNDRIFSLHPSHCCSFLLNVKVAIGGRNIPFLCTHDGGIRSWSGMHKGCE